LNVLFMGTGPLGIPSLERLVSSEKYQLVGIITQPDRPAGRGMKLRPSPVKEFGVLHNIPVSQPEEIKREPEVVREFEADVVVVAAYGQILSREIIDIPPLGTINIHASLLPKYRGAAPIQWALINGDLETGVTTFYIDEGLDTGDVLLERAIPIGPDDTAGSLHDKLALLGADVIVETLDGIASGTLEAHPQEHSQATHAPKITKEMARIDWSKSSRDLFNLIRGLNPVPGAFTLLEGKRLKVHFAVVHNKSAKSGAYGEILDFSEEGLVVQTGDGQLLLTELQPEGKRKMPANEFIRGHQVSLNSILGDQ